MSAQAGAAAEITTEDEAATAAPAIICLQDIPTNDNIIDMAKELFGGHYEPIMSRTKQRCVSRERGQADHMILVNKALDIEVISVQRMGADLYRSGQATALSCLLKFNSIINSSLDGQAGAGGDGSGDQHSRWSVLVFSIYRVAIKD